MPRPKPEPQTCGEPAEDGQHCNLPKGHPADQAHTFIAPLREQPPATGSVNAERAKTVPDPAGEALQQAAERIYADDLVKRPVIVKLARIMGKLGTIEPQGRNAHFGYNFIKDTQVSGAIRPRMAEERLMVIPNVLEETWVETKTAKGATSWVTKLKVEFTVIDGDSGDSVTGTGYGYGDDSGDKGANKALTAAMKYWLIKLFQIGGEDAESDDRADKRAAARQEGGPAVTIEKNEITGIARGGRSDRMTNTQKKQIFALYKDLDLTAESFTDRIDTILGDKLALPEDGDATAALNKYLDSLGADDAGKLIVALIDEKDAREVGPSDAPGDRQENEPEEPDGPIGDITAADGTPYG